MVESTIYVIYFQTICNANIQRYIGTCKNRLKLNKALKTKRLFSLVTQSRRKGKEEADRKR